jgi:serine phosphatase RsbU (regulator of sigma subunit)
MLLTEPDAALNRITNELARVFDVPTAAISFIDRDTQYYTAAVGIPEPFATTRVEPREISICSFVVGNNDMLIVQDLAADARFRDSSAVIDLGIRFYAGAPLRADSGRAIGSLCILDSRPRTISNREREMLRIVAEGVMAQVRLQVASRRLFTSATRIEEELQRAVKVQRFLLPASPFEASGWYIRHLYRPMAHLGGDFLDVVTRPDGGVAVLVADVTGHGTDAALTAAMIKTAFVRAVAESEHGDETLNRMNDELTPAIPPGQFITAVTAILAADTATVEISSAGHPPPIIVRTDCAEPIKMRHNFPLAIAGLDRAAERSVLSLDRSDRLLFYTDGAFEVAAAADPSDRLGIERLAKLAHESLQGEQAGFLRRILDRIDGFAGGLTSDDVALLEVMRPG